MCTKFVLINKLVLIKFNTFIYYMYMENLITPTQDSSCINWIVINAIENIRRVKNCHQTLESGWILNRSLNIRFILDFEIILVCFAKFLMLTSMVIGLWKKTNTVLMDFKWFLLWNWCLHFTYRVLPVSLKSNLRARITKNDYAIL